MAHHRPVQPSTLPIKRNDQYGSNRSLQGSVRGSQNGKDRRSTTGSSIYGYLVGGHGSDAREIRQSLEKGAVILTGGRDPQGGPIITFPCNKRHIDITHHDISSCLTYLIQIPSEETKRRGFTVIVDNRDDSWSNLVTVLGCLKQCLGDYLKQVYVLQKNYDRRANQRKDKPSYNIQPQFVVESQLHSLIDRNQLAEEVGGYLTYNHSIWLHNILEQEKFLREAQSTVQHLDNKEVKIQQTYNLKDPQASPLEALRQHRYFQESIMTEPTEIIQRGQNVLQNLQRVGHGRFRSGNETVNTLDNLEAQKQVKRVIQYLENRVDKLRDFLEDRDKSLNFNMQTEDWKRCVKTVVHWILGPGEKLLASRTDIGDSFETADELRKRHEEMEIKCTDTYGQYAELRHQAEELIGEETIASSDIRAERDYMDTISRSFAARLERRRILLLTSVRFHRFAEDFSRQLDALLELVCSDISAETVEEAEGAIKQLNEMCQAIDEAAQQTLNDGQSLLDEMSRPIKNAFGKDITPDYDSHIKRINQKLEDLQERKMRCDELADVRKLKLQQILQLRTCERDADKAIDWIEELCTVMVTEHHDLGKNPEEAESLQEQHRKFESTAAGTYEYGKQLLQGALVLRRSLRYDLEPNNDRAYRLEEAWKKFTQGTSERTNRLTVASMFMAASDKVNDRIEQILVVISQALDRQITVEEVLTKYHLPKDKVIKDYEDAVQMGKALLDRIALPVVIDGKQPSQMDNEKAADIINTKLRRMDRKASDLEKYWSELIQNRNNPNFVPKLTRTPSRRKVADIADAPKRSPSKRSGRQKSLDGKGESKQHVQALQDAIGSNPSSPKYTEIQQRISAIRSYQQASALVPSSPSSFQQDSIQTSPQSQNTSLEPNLSKESYQEQMSSINYPSSFVGMDYSHPSSINYSSALQELPGNRGSRSDYLGSQQPYHQDSPGSRNSSSFNHESPENSKLMPSYHSNKPYSSQESLNRNSSFQGKVPYFVPGSPGDRNSRSSVQGYPPQYAENIPGSRDSRSSAPGYPPQYAENIPGSRDSRSSAQGYQPQYAENIPGSRDSRSSAQGYPPQYAQNIPGSRDSRSSAQGYPPQYAENVPGSRDSRSSYHGNQPHYAENVPGSRDSRSSYHGNQPPYAENIPGSRDSRSSYHGNQPSIIESDDLLQSVHAKPVFIEAPSQSTDLQSDLQKVRNCF